ncbi:hypothetical protein M569_00550, partial [Genlisea aurea]
DFNLPEEILSVIPKDPYDQLDLARKITSMAIASRVVNLEAEAGNLRENLVEKDRLIVELENKVAKLENSNKEAEMRWRVSREENIKLWKEKENLSTTVKKLSRDVMKLETFKRQLMQSLNEDNSPTEPVDIGTYDQSAAKPYPVYDESTGLVKQHHSYTESDTINDDVSKQRYSIASYTTAIAPRLTPTTRTPNAISASVSPRNKYSAAVSPQKSGAPTSPSAHYEGRGSLSSWIPSSLQSSAANSPPRGQHQNPARAPRIDGKEFFRQARNRLSLEQFSAFLSNVKELNAQKQSREETLRKAEEIFGTENKDLFLSFQGLLNRN